MGQIVIDDLPMGSDKWFTLQERGKNEKITGEIRVLLN